MAPSSVYVKPPQPEQLLVNAHSVKHSLEEKKAFVECGSVGSSISDRMASDLESDDSRDFECDEHTNFDRLVDDIKAILGPTSGLDCSEVDESLLMERLSDYMSKDSEWSKYAFVDNSYDYTRNLIDDINHKANLLILVWTPGRGSDIHDHANAHCVVKMLSGTLRETLYDMPDSSNPQHLQVTRVTDLHRDQVSYMSDKLGLHRMENPGSVPAISLHLYTPPHAAKFGCNIYDELTGEKKHVRCCMYSKHGQRI
ncbi:Cysteine dioxygenase [Wickerhamiella sorbophila]|uniref:Cysteine dioxygenase n=1 Tax=Wickerhamiella sorbophila TaxID=45607 RepID=A0A2T0FJ12_9ASCO|nr:Cysteine dioxygenase [Wickerhamiella sorbophila]PRT54994.1 Cysteine dioxygenase [Wickerhamiella sorbophila]